MSGIEEDGMEGDRGKQKRNGVDSTSEGNTHFGSDTYTNEVAKWLQDRLVQIAALGKFEIICSGSDFSLRQLLSLPLLFAQKACVH